MFCRPRCSRQPRHRDREQPPAWHLLGAARPRRRPRHRAGSGRSPQS